MAPGYPNYIRINFLLLLAFLAIINSKIEIRNKFQIQKPKIQKRSLILLTISSRLKQNQAHGKTVSKEVKKRRSWEKTSKKNMNEKDSLLSFP
jgi:hypothetical protein